MLRGEMFGGGNEEVFMGSDLGFWNLSLTFTRFKLAVVGMMCQGKRDSLRLLYSP